MAIEDSVISSWVGDGRTALPAVPGPTSGFSRELLQVSIFLAAFSGLYFTVYAVTDSNYRDQFFHEITDELERAVGVRAAYLALRRGSSTAGPRLGSDAMEYRTLGGSGMPPCRPTRWAR